MREYDPDADLQLKRVAQFIAKEGRAMTHYKRKHWHFFYIGPFGFAFYWRRPGTEGDLI